ncbi:MAG: hypothetical protein M3340_11860, partial [Actinomycetota bacterium]|nr:hypothetical protein [Actinomycetota bacterium]
MAWWRPEEERSPQARVGQTQHQPRLDDPAHGPADPDPLAPLPVYRARSGLPWGLPLIAVVALVFVVVMVAPFLFAFDAFDGDGGGGGGGFGGSHDGPSLVPRERFARAMDKVRSEAGAEASVQVLRVAPDRIDAVVRRANGQRTTI